ncbi:mandelate racemase/muconate lactonizing enzyme family protein [Salinisphaera hydrothermalis]|uniref:Mandelate racemase/muconate lactonizing-like protein n=1 Tax=Salinisphaera hydrothermalis (strain C41B8) TaxID=1304275 RepID=A0A084IL85_SALHC|nr:mandelate racemase/muconate lactonizing enzyme family protein [Salinisphaera hydrothermalis]KEZ77469.1 mandelate racemase/muconate lactonizing-like protein [Salinisphaera hydrothermalis C41B8]
MTTGPVLKNPSSKIEQAQVRLVDMPLESARGGSGATQLQLAIVRVTDEDGAIGTGYTYTLGPGMVATAALLEELHLPAIVGLATERWDQEWYRLRDTTHRLGNGVPLLATSAVDIAIWDLRAMRAELPLYRLLGAQRDRVPVYGSGRATHAMTTEQLIEGSISYVEEGYTAVKLRIGARRPEEDLARVAAVRAALGEGIGIMIDANERLDLPTAQWFASQLVDLGVQWFEEPLDSRHIEGYRALSRGRTPPLAVGEHVLGLSAFSNFAGTASIWMPDVPLTGGVSEFRRIDSLAEAHGAVITPHFLPELHVHLVAAGRAATWLEHFPLLDDLLSETLQIDNGWAMPPEYPGHGLRWDQEKIERFTVRLHETSV